MILSFQHAGLQAFFETGSKRGIQPAHAKKLRLQLTALSVATCPQDMRQSSYGLHSLKGELAGHWSVWVNGSWRLTFRFEGEDVILVNYTDYH